MGCISSKPLSEATYNSSQYTEPVPLKQRSNVRTSPRHQNTGALSGLEALPAEVIQKIASPLPPQHRIALSGVSRPVRSMLVAEREAAKTSLSFANADVSTLSSFNDALIRIQSLQRRLQSEPLAHLAGQIRGLPGMDRQSTFNDVLAEVWHLPEDRSDPLAKLASQIPYLRASSQPTAFAGVLRAVAALPPADRGEPLTQLAIRITGLPDRARQPVFDGVLDAVKHLPRAQRSEPLRELAQQIGALPANQMTAFNGVLDAVKQLPAAHRRELLAELAIQIGSLHLDKMTAFNGVLDAIRAVPPADRGELLAQIGQLLPHNREAAMAAVEARQ